MAQPDRVYPIVFQKWLNIKADRQRVPVRVRLHPFHFQQLLAEMRPEEITCKGEDTYIPSFLGSICVAPDAACSLDCLFVDWLAVTPVQMPLPFEWAGVA